MDVPFGFFLVIGFPLFATQAISVNSAHLSTTVCCVQSAYSNIMFRVSHRASWLVSSWDPGTALRIKWLCFLASGRHVVSFRLPRPSTMNPKSQLQKHRDTVLSSLNAAIDAMNIAKDVLSMTPAKAAFGAVSVILTMIRVSFHPVHVGLSLANVYRTP